MHGQLNLASLESKLRLNCLRWYWHVEKSDKWINKCTHLEIGGFTGRGRLRKTWSATVTENLKTRNIDAKANNAHDRSVRKKTLRAAMKSPPRKYRGQVAQNG